MRSPLWLGVKAKANKNTGNRKNEKGMRRCSSVERVIMGCGSGEPRYSYFEKGPSTI